MRRRRLMFFLILLAAASCCPCRRLDVSVASAPAPAPLDFSSCSSAAAAVSCGRINITYPFHLSSSDSGGGGGGGGGSSFFCGYPGLSLDCVDGNETVLQLSTNNNTVLAINYPTRTMFVVDSGIHRASSGCPMVANNVTLGGAPVAGGGGGSSTTGLRFTSSDASLTFLVGCRPDVPSRCLDGSVPVGCDLGGAAAPGESSYIFRGGGAASGGALAGASISDDCTRFCSSMVTMPVYGALFDVPSLSNLTTSYGRVLKNGFELSWDTNSDERCTLCERSGGRCSYSRTNTSASGGGGGGALAFNCLCPDGRTRPSDCGHHTRGRETRIYVIAATSSIGALLLLFAAYLAHCKRTYGTLLFWRKRSYIAPRVKDLLQRHGPSLNPKIYSYLEVKRMTKSFAHQLGQGGCGVVYKGKLPADGRAVAVKILKGSKGDDEQFMNEVASISATSHVNIVTLLGFCIQGSRRALIYDYMPNGSLARFILSSQHSDNETHNSLSWDKRFEIAVGIARGLEYLHRGCNTRIVHFDIKPHNILLDEDFCPKISDFGLAKLCTQKETTVSVSVVRGTVGYIAPEVFSKQFGVVSSKSDVYSYGMMILEMVSCTRNASSSSNVSSWGNSVDDEFYFPRWIYQNIDQYCLEASEMVSGAEELVRKMIIVGLWCIQVMPVDRPSMTGVIEMLEGSSRDLQLPSKLMTSFLENHHIDTISTTTYSSTTTSPVAPLNSSIKM